jgi:hypothetical protein
MERKTVEIKFEDLPVGVKFWAFGDEKKCSKDVARIKFLDDGEVKIKFDSGRLSSMNPSDYENHPVFVYESDLEAAPKQWPDKMILIARTEQEAELMHDKWPGEILYPLPVCFRIVCGEHHSQRSLSFYIRNKEEDYPEYTFIEASDYFGLKQADKIGDVADSKTETINQKGKTMLYEVAITKSAIQRAGKGYEDGSVLLEPVYIEAPSSEVAIAKAAQGIKEPLAELDRLKIIVRKFGD